jgi:predicted RNase H-like HicB family nuclease
MSTAINRIARIPKVLPPPRHKAVKRSPKPPSSLHVRIKPDPMDGGFVASCKELPGCWSEGETYEEAFQNIAEAIVAILQVESQDRAAV